MRERHHNLAIEPVRGCLRLSLLKGLLSLLHHRVGPRLPAPGRVYQKMRAVRARRATFLRMPRAARYPQ